MKRSIYRIAFIGILWNWSYELDLDFHSLICYAEIPPEINMVIAYGDDYNIYVPPQSVALYKNDELWGVYRNVIFPLTNENAR